MEIVDAQFHPDRIGPRWSEASPDELVDSAVAAMDAVGIDAALLDEWIGWDERGGIIPGHDGPDGIRRADYPVAERAVARYPERFAYVARIGRTDPELERMMAALRDHAGRLALRWCPPAEAGESEPFRAGEYDRFFSLAQEHQVPVFLAVPDQMDVLEPYVRRFPDLWFVVDHCGVSFPQNGEAPPTRFDGLRAVIEMARHPNVALKWCHAPRLSAEDFPYRDVLDHFRLVLDAFGAERVMWASDHTQALRSARPHRTFNWSESLHYLLHADGISPSEKEWIFGKTVRTIVRWPSAA